MEQDATTIPVVPREDVLHYGVLPIALLGAQLGESPSSLLALHRSLSAKATVNADGDRELPPASDCWTDRGMAP